MHSIIEVLGQQLGGVNVLNSLPQNTLATALTHTDDVLGLGWDRPVFEIPDLDLTAGYTVFDDCFDILYTVASLSLQAFGTQALDTAWFLSRRLGDFIFVAYTNLAGVDRVLMVIRI